MATPRSLDGLISKAEAYLKPAQVQQIIAAFEFGDLAHAGQTRKAGGAYIWHPVAVAEILAEIQLDHESLIAAILHDVIEDTPYTKQDIIDRFGDKVADIIDGVTKLGKLAFDNPQEAQAESFRKMMLAMSRDIRVILIKLADRLHNMRTLGVMRPDKQRRIARETLDIYAPIAARLGINSFRIELEDLGFKAMYPKRYAALEKAIKKARGNRKEVVDQISDALTARLKQEGYDARVLGREKHLYSLYKKMHAKRLSFVEVLDIFAFRIIVPHVDDCYRALGLVHSLYKPLPGKFKDYIAIPKANGYQSLHTLLFGPFGVHIEVQIRTDAMHDVSEHGIAAHWHYKLSDEGAAQTHAIDERAQEWVRNLLEIQQSAGNSLDFLENVKIDLFPDVTYVFTPQGDIITLPRNATAVDFAYAVHTNLGHACVGCRIDRQLMPLRTTLESGQTVEIIKSKETQPNPNWLNFVTTAKARAQIRSFLKNQHDQSAEELGQKLLTKALLTHGLSYNQLTEQHLITLIAQLHLENWSQLLNDIGLGRRMAGLVAKQIADTLPPKTDAESSQDSETKPVAQASAGAYQPLAISGTEGLVVNYAQCCHPIPGDDIIGFMSSGKGLVIHRQDCKNVRHYQNQPDKWLDVEWSPASEQLFSVDVQIEAKNQRGTLAMVASEIANTKTDIQRVRSEDKDETYSVMHFVLSVRNLEHLDDLLRHLRRIPLIEKAFRVDSH